MKPKHFHIPVYIYSQIMIPVSWYSKDEKILYLISNNYVQYIQQMVVVSMMLLQHSHNNINLCINYQILVYMCCILFKTIETREGVFSLCGTNFDLKLWFEKICNWPFNMHCIILFYIFILSDLTVLFFANNHQQ